MAITFEEFAALTKKDQEAILNAVETPHYECRVCYRDFTLQNATYDYMGRVMHICPRCAAEQVAGARRSNFADRLNVNNEIFEGAADFADLYTDNQCKFEKTEKQQAEIINTRKLIIAAFIAGNKFFPR